MLGKENKVWKHSQTSRKGEERSLKNVAEEPGIMASSDRGAFKGRWGRAPGIRGAG